MNIPNIISLIRIIASPVMWVLIYFDFQNAFTWLLTFAFFTDLIDGVIARKLHQVSKLGSVLDSYGDSLTIISGTIGLVKFNQDIFEQHSIIISIIIGCHIIQLLLSLWRYGKPSSFHTWSAKFGALAVGLLILFTLHFYFSPLLFYITALILIVDAFEESILVFLFPEWKNDVKGLFWVLKNKGEKGT
jgi:phosphatidylglycerophosphate synthase